MRLAFLFLLGTAYILVSASDPVLVCRDDKSDRCSCTITKELHEITSLRIECSFWPGLNTTNIAVPDSLTKNISVVDIRFINTGISQLTSPLISKQLAGMIRGLEITGTRITRIDEKVFDGLPKLKELGLMESSINDKLLNSGWLTSNLGKTLEVLDFSYNNLNTIQEGSFQNLASLIQLRVSGNQIQQISDSMFDNLVKLESLDLSNNEITQLNSFGNLVALQSLRLDLNQISQIPKNTFSKLANLITIYLSYNYLSDIPDSSVFAKPNKLTYLYLDSNKIKTIGSFNGFDQLEHLDISSNQIKTVSGTAFDGVSKLKTLILYGNMIKELVKGVFKPLKQLQELWLSGNLLQLQAGVFNGLESLVLLYLDKNNIQNTDHVFDGLSKLDSLTLSENFKLILTDETFSSSGPTNLHYLGLSKCALTSLPATFLKNLQSLVSLNIDYNQFTSVPAALRNTKSLKMLDISWSNITSIQNRAFGNNPSLTQLTLDNLGNLSYVEDCGFCGLTSLEICSLNDNENLKQINENAFGILKNSIDKANNITMIQIHDGGLKTVPMKLLQWDKIRISILGNPANCDASSDWLFYNTSLNLDTSPTARYYDPSWCKQCMHDKVCQKLHK